MAAEPPELKARPHVGRFPVPYITAIINGEPDFRAHDEQAREQVAAGRLCQLCGQPLGETMVFVGVPASIRERIFGEPPMHRDCMEWAWEVCPWLAGRGWRDEWRHEHATVRRIKPPEIRPSALGIYVTTGYTLVESAGAARWSYAAQINVRPIEYRRR